MNKVLTTIPKADSTAIERLGGRPRVATPLSGSRPGPRWFVVATYSQAERRARQHLTEQGYQAYLPLITVSRRDRHTPTMLHRVEVPLFPAYLFCRFDCFRDPWRPILHTLGVYDLIRKADGMPNPCPDGAIEAVRAGESQLATRAPEIALWAPGTPCSLGKGIMAGHPAVVLAITNDTARVGLMFLGEMRTFRCPVEYLTPRAP